MLLRPANLDDSMLWQPLPWNLYTATGVLVLGAGACITDAGQLAGLQARTLYRPADFAGDNHPGNVLRALIAQLDSLYALPGDIDLDGALRHAASHVTTLYRSDADAAIGLSRLIDSPSRATRHCLLCALVCLGLGEHLELDETARETLVLAALSMNIASMKLHNELADRNQPDAHERERIGAHPGASVDVLYARGITDRDWLDTVFQHHENMDGSGYPAGLQGTDICLHARILRVADLYCAKIAGRYYRPPRSSLFAMQYLFGHERRRIDTHIAGLLLRRFGFFPPGTLVTLDNHETAVVTRVQTRKQALRHVVSVLDARQRPLERPSERDTQKSGFGVLRLTAAEPDWPPIRWESAWGYA